jgi:outer membrane lipoprotein-sorting protein
LCRALLRTSQLVFSGEQTLLTFDESDGAACVTWETHLGDGRYRIVYLNPVDAHGRIEIADGTWRQTYLPPTHTVVKTRVIDPPLTAANADARIARIRQRYRLRLEPKPEQIEGRQADRLEIRPRKPDRPWQRLWIDRATGLILRRESYRSDGVQVAVSYWRNLHFGGASPTALHWTPPPGARVDTSAAKTSFRLSEARALAGSWAALPASLGDGFAFASARLVTARGSNGLYCQYSDGLNTVSLIQIAGSRPISTGAQDSPNVHSARIGTTKAQVASRGSMTVLSWENSRHAITMSLVAEMTEHVLITIASSLH